MTENETPSEYTLRAEINFTGVMKTTKIELKTNDTDQVHLELKEICDSLIINEYDFVQITILNQKVSTK